MKIKLIIFATLSILIISGCSSIYIVCSIYPFYLTENILNEDHIEGIWKASLPNEVEIPEKVSKSDAEYYNYYWDTMDTLCKWKIKRYAYGTRYRSNSGKDSIGFMPDNFYIVQLTGNSPDTAFYRFKLVLFRVKGALYGDFTPYEIDGLTNSLLANSHYFRMHTLAKINLSGQSMKISFLSDDTMKDLIGFKHARIKHQLIGETNRLTLTATSKDLTAMIEKYGNSPRFIEWDRQSTMLSLTSVK